MKTSPLFLAAFFLAASLHAEEGNLLPNSSFEKINPLRQPAGWGIFFLPKDACAAADVTCVTSGTAGQDTHSGVAALQFAFPKGAIFAQANWYAHPSAGGAGVAPGHYTCSFWIKATGLAEKAHTWVNLTGFGADNKAIKEVSRSPYLFSKDFPNDNWTKFSFPVEIKQGEGVVTVAPSVVFKTTREGTPSVVPPATRILVDDLELIKN